MQSPEISANITKPSFLLIGSAGQGKTYTANQLLNESGMVGCVLDIFGEYDPNKNIIFKEWDYFLDYISTCENKFIIIDEGTSFLSMHSVSEMIKIITQIRHRGNCLCICLFTLIKTPQYILDNLPSGYMYLMQTTDKEERLTTGNRKYLIPYLQKVKATNQPLWIDLNKI